MKNKSPFLLSVQEIVESNKKYKNGNLLVHKNDFSPLSGFEKKYDPSKWNDNLRIKQNHNCYAYVLDQIVSNRDGKPQPGYFSNFPPLKYSDYNCYTFYTRLRKDVPSLYVTTFDEKCRKGYHKGFIAIDKKKSDTDYHFYRQDDNGYWSHKPGRQDVVNTDASNKKIKNPLIANRNYKYFNYSTPCFFFCSNTKLSRAISTPTYKR